MLQNTTHGESRPAAAHFAVNAVGDKQLAAVLVNSLPHVLFKPVMRKSYLIDWFLPLPSMWTICRERVCYAPMQHELALLASKGKGIEGVGGRKIDGQTMPESRRCSSLHSGGSNPGRNDLEYRLGIKVTCVCVHYTQPNIPLIGGLNGEFFFAATPCQICKFLHSRLGILQS